MYLVSERSSLTEDSSSFISQHTSRCDITVSTERLPSDILVKLVSISLELNLPYTSRTTREQVSNGIGIDKAFSVGAKTITLVALMFPYSWNDRFMNQRGAGFLDIEKSRNTVQHLVPQEKVFDSAWFPAQAWFDSYVLPRLMRLSLEMIAVAFESAKTLRDMPKAYPAHRRGTLRMTIMISTPASGGVTARSVCKKW
jgi:hypothetical protein